MDTMDWISILVGLVSGGVAAGVAAGVMRGQVNAIRHELDSLRHETQREASECRLRIDRLLNTLSGGQQ